MCIFFFFKQKTAYEMRISDWSSDVCSSDLTLAARRHHAPDQGLLRARGRNRTDDLLFTRQVLCRLSYSGGATRVPTAVASASGEAGCLIHLGPGRPMVGMPLTDLTDRKSVV